MPDSSSDNGPSFARNPPNPPDPWIRPERILVATDLSDLDRLMPFAFEQATETGARLLLLHVLASGVAIAADASGVPFFDPAGAIEFVEKTMTPWCEFAGRQGIGCDALVREGHPAQHIAAAIRQFHVDRILLGTRSRSRLGKLLLGSVAEQVLRSVNLPVITVGPEAHLPVARSERVVLHATTLKETSRTSAALAFQIAANQGAKLVLLHVLPPEDDPGVFEPEVFGPHVRRAGAGGQPAALDSVALQRLRTLAGQTLTAQPASQCSPAIDPHVVHGNPSIEILAAAAEMRANLIVLGATDRSAFANLTRDRTIYRVLAHARCPVLTLREPHTASPAAERHSIVQHL